MLILNNATLNPLSRGILREAVRVAVFLISILFLVFYGGFGLKKFRDSKFFLVGFFW